LKDVTANDIVAFAGTSGTITATGGTTSASNCKRKEVRRSI